MFVFGPNQWGAEYVSRIKGGENIADLRETEGNQYPVSKELV